MLIADGGGGYGGTEWASKDVRFMWSTIANQETDPHFDVVGGWRKTADLTLAHLGQVQMYRDNLATVWPPTKSAAAAAYLARLDKLIADLQATHEAASANYTAFSTVTLTLSLARHKLKPILEQYEANEQLNLDWQAKQDAAAAKSEVLLTPVFKLPPVSSARQEELNNQARAIMYDLSSTVLSGQAALQKPKPYTPGADSRTDPPEGSDVGSGSGFAVPPVIPAPGASVGGSRGSTVTPPPNSIVTPTSPTTTVPVGTGNGPVLGGTGPTPVITPPTTGLPPTPGPGPLPAPTPPGLTPGIIGPVGGPGLPPGGLLPTNGGRVPPNSMTKPGTGTAVRTTMPSGGVIGATPGSGMIGQVPPAGMGNRAGGSARVNPVGGVIGQPGNGPAGRSTSPGLHGAGGLSGPMANQAGQRRGRQQAEGQANWDPDNPWATDEGVAPVVLPPDAPGPIDPGPAIGYSR